MILDRGDPGKYNAVKKHQKWRLLQATFGVSTFVTWSSTPARTSTIAKAGDSAMNIGSWKVKVL
ncbi:MAG: hypothetical protein M3R61_19650 [Chloroflexota bacterium]|nr:hypothetical protein [Chloroflexota bacterium]